MTTMLVNVHEDATPDAAEVLVTLTVDGLRVNHLLRAHHALRAQLAATPRMIPNPARAALEQIAFEAAVAERAVAATLHEAPPEPAVEETAIPQELGALTPDVPALSETTAISAPPAATISPFAD